MNSPEPYTGDAPPAPTVGQTPAPARRWLRILRGIWPPLVLALVGYLGWRDLRGLDLHALHAITRNLSDLDLLALQLLALVPVLAMCGYDLLA